MAFKFYIDNQLTDQPLNGTELLTTIKRDSEMGAFLITQDVTLVYGKVNLLDPGVISGYDYLKTRYDQGVCDSADVVIYDQVSDTETYRVYTGTISVVDMEVDEQRYFLSTKIDDNSFYSFIKNNQNVPFSLFADTTKNGEPISPPPIWEVSFFDAATYTTVTPPVLGYRIYDVLRFLIPAISDNKVTFESDFLLSMTVSGTPLELFIFDGFAISNPGTSPNITATLGKILSELYKLKNISFYIDQNDPDNPVLRLERSDWFYLGTDILTFSSPLYLTSNIKQTKFYGTIRTGADYNPCGLPPVYNWNCGTSYYGHKDEVYTPYGQCNNENELNLINEFIIASNAINDQAIGGTTDNYDKVFLVECFQIDYINLTADTIGWDTYATAPERHYNVGLNNVNKVWLHGGNFQSALTNTQNAGTDIFKASLGSDEIIMDQTPGNSLLSTFTSPTVVVPIPFADELGGGNYDPGGNYDNVTDFIYTVPTDGSYSFKTFLNVEFENLKECITTQNTAIGQTNIQTQYGVIFTVVIEAYDNAAFGTLLYSSTNTTTVTVNGVQEFNIAFVHPLELNNVVRVRTISQFAVYFPTIFGNNPLSAAVRAGGLCGYQSGEPKARVIALSDSYFECNGTPEGGLVLAQPDPELYKAKQLSFEHDLTQTEIRQIIATPIGRFEILKDEISRHGWIEEMQINNWTGRSKVKLITNNATT